MSLPAELDYLDQMIDVLVDELIERECEPAEKGAPVGNKPTGAGIKTRTEHDNHTKGQVATA